MIVSSSTAGAAWFLEGMNNLQNQITQTSRQLSSGYKIQSAADSPSQTPLLVNLGSNLASLQGYQTNLTNVHAEASGADTAIAGAITLLDSARSLATQGASSSATATDRQNLAVQIQSIQQQIVGAANTTVGGRYIFGGGQDQSAPYQIDSASATGVDQLTSQTAAGVIVNPQGQPVYQAATAQGIFDPRDATGAPGSANTFAALQSLSTALSANDPAGVASALTSLQSASSYLNQQQASYGTQEQRITSEQNSAANQITAIQAQISGIRDTDVTQAASNLLQESTAESAALSAQNLIPRKSLFDYLG